VFEFCITGKKQQVQAVDHPGIVYLETGLRGVTRVCYPWVTMSAINGDKARFHRERKAKLARRERSQAMRKKLKSPGSPRPSGTQL